jgi:SAM-dependent methyltransferase
MSRTDALLAGAARHWKILEIGPSHAPIAPRSDGWDTTIVDYTTRAGLVAKYREDPTVDPSRIEEVDVVWQDGPLEAAIPAAAHGSYDLLIASHVIEHLPDPIGLLRSAARVLKPGTGRISLAVPDKRSCFDFFRPPSTTGKLLAAHLAQRDRHALADLFDTYAYYVTLRGESGWEVQPSGEVRLTNTLDFAWRAMQDSTEAAGSPYQDCHAWVMTPASFELMILEVARTGLIDWRIESSEAQAGVEFIVRMARGREDLASAEAFEALRRALLHRCVQDLHEWTSTMLVAPEAAEPPPPGPVESPTAAQQAWRRVMPVPMRAAIARIRGLR